MKQCIDRQFIGSFRARIKPLTAHTRADNSDVTTRSSSRKRFASIVSTGTRYQWLQSERCVLRCFLASAWLLSRLHAVCFILLYFWPV